LIVARIIPGDSVIVSALAVNPIFHADEREPSPDSSGELPVLRY